jgi:hypothetical protein
VKRYGKVTRCMWGDAKFRRLSAPPPNGRSLWLFLLTCEEASIIPGVIRGGEAAIAEANGWELKGFREAFGEVFREGLAKADWKARLVWLPRASRAQRAAVAERRLGVGQSVLRAAGLASKS